MHAHKRKSAYTYMFIYTCKETYVVYRALCMHMCMRERMWMYACVLAWPACYIYSCQNVSLSACLSVYLYVHAYLNPQRCLTLRSSVHREHRKGCSPTVRAEAQLGGRRTLARPAPVAPVASALTVSYLLHT